MHTSYRELQVHDRLDRSGKARFSNRAFFMVLMKWSRIGASPFH